VTNQTSGQDREWKRIISQLALRVGARRKGIAQNYEALSFERYRNMFKRKVN